MFFSPYKNPIKADIYACKIEDFLDSAAWIPICGVIPALTKSLFGVFQATAALSLATASMGFLGTDLGQKTFLHSLRHFIHGIANIFSGFIIAIPIVGTLNALRIENSRIASMDFKHCIISDQNHKIFGYKTIEDTSWKHAGCDDEEREIIAPEDVETKKNDARFKFGASFCV